MALIGLRDVRDYRMRVVSSALEIDGECGGLESTSTSSRAGHKKKLRPDADSMGTSSPFNIKVESVRLRDFTAEEVARLYRQHTDETGQAWTDEAVARVFELTRGQPWLVNALAYHVTTRMVRDRGVTLRMEHIEEARAALIERRDTHLDSLVARLDEPRVRRVIEPILTGEASFDPTFNDDFAFVRDLGLVAEREGSVAIANPIYAEIIPRVLGFHVQMGIHLEPRWFVAADGTLDVMKLIEEFLELWRRHGEVLLRGMPYHEAAPHLVFMAYLQRVIHLACRPGRDVPAVGLVGHTRFHRGRRPLFRGCGLDRGCSSRRRRVSLVRRSSC
jgi:hypothetical protein